MFSTLVDILAGKRKSGRTEGDVRITSAAEASAGRAQIGYVDQADVLSENLSKCLQQTCDLPANLVWQPFENP